MTFRYVQFVRLHSADQEGFAIKLFVGVEGINDDRNNAKKNEKEIYKCQINGIFFAAEKENRFHIFIQSNIAFIYFDTPHWLRRICSIAQVSP